MQKTSCCITLGGTVGQCCSIFRPERVQCARAVQCRQQRRAADCVSLRTGSSECTTVGISGVSQSDQITADQYLTTIRPQVLNYLNSSSGANVTTIVTTKGLPLRIYNTQSNPGTYPGWRFFGHADHEQLVETLLQPRKRTDADRQDRFDRGNGRPGISSALPTDSPPRTRRRTLTTRQRHLLTAPLLTG